jgi:LysM repeat protein
MISFALQKTGENESVSATIESLVEPPTSVELQNPIESQKENKIEEIPFMAAEPAATEIETEKETEIKNPIRESVERFVKAQAVLVESGDSVKIRNAFVQLSRLYEHRELNHAEKIFMQPLLDRLAINVIYSRNVHVLEPPYTIIIGDSIDSIAQKFNISSALLMKINGLTGAKPLESGTNLKVVVGHFDAKISIARRELTLILGGLYAGRFHAVSGERIGNLRGEFYVSSKTDTWNDKSVTLNNGVTFYGTDQLQPSDSLATTVRFSIQDAKELFDILTERSVIIFED